MFSGSVEVKVRVNSGSSWGKSSLKKKSTFSFRFEGCTMQTSPGLYLRSPAPLRSNWKSLVSWKWSSEVILSLEANFALEGTEPVAGLDLMFVAGSFLATW